MAKRGESIAAASHAELEKLRADLEMAQREIDTKDKLIAGYVRSNETASRMLEDSARELGALNKRSHDLANELQSARAQLAEYEISGGEMVKKLHAAERERHQLANDLTSVQARLTMLLQDRGAHPRGICEYPGCNGPVPPGETICGAVHAQVGRRA